MNAIKKAVYAGLRRSEPFLKTDMVYAAKGGFWTGVSFVVGTIASLATMVAFGNLVSKETYGTYNYLLSLAGSVGFLTLSGIGTGVTRAVARGQENVVPHAMRIQLQYNSIIFLVIIAIATYYGLRGNSLFAISLSILAVATPLASAFHLNEAVLIGQKRFAALSTIAVLSNLSAALATVITLFLTYNIVIIVGVYAFFSLVPSMLAYAYAKRSLPRTRPSPESIVELRHTAFHLTGAGIIGTVAQYIDKLLLFQFAGPVALATYGFSIAGPERLKGLIKNWVGISLPKNTIRTLAELNKVLHFRLLISLLLGFSFALVYVSAAPFLFKLFLPKYLDSIAYSQVFALGLIFVPITAYIGNIFTAQNMLRAIYIQNFLSHTTKLVLFPLFAWLWQIWGLVFASILSYVLMAVYAVVILKFETKRMLNAQKDGKK